MASKVKADTEKGDMTSMIDVVFLLLIFFMCAAKFKTLESKLQANLPKDMGESSAPAPDVTPRRIELKVQTYSTDSGKKVAKEILIQVGSNVVGRYLRPAFATSDVERNELTAQRQMVITRLREQLEEMKRMDDPSVRTPTFIAPDLRIPSDDVVQVLDAVIAAKITDLTFAGKVSDIEKLRREDGIDD